MERILRGLRRPECLSRFGRAASVSLPLPTNSTTESPERNPAPPSQADIRSILQSSSKPTKRTEAPSSSFLSVSRTKVEEVTRNKTGSPDVGRYHPNYDVGKLRTDRSPMYNAKSTSPRDQRILLPLCLGRIETSYPRHDRNASANLPQDSTFDGVSKRTVTDLRKFARVAEEKNGADSPGKPEGKKKGLVALDQQLVRPMFVRGDGPPNPKRFSSRRNDSLVISSNKRIREVSFTKALERPELFRPNPLPDYRPNTRLTRRGSPQSVEFGKRTGRKTLALEHMLKNPPQVDQKRIDRAWDVLRSNTGNMPKLDLIAPRDDLMYRTNGQYKLNVPHKQLATDVPSFQGESGKEAKPNPGDLSITFYL